MVKSLQIASIVRENDKAITIQELHELLQSKKIKIRIDTMCKHLSDLTEKGILTRVSEGKYEYNNDFIDTCEKYLLSQNENKKNEILLEIYKKAIQRITPAASKKIERLITEGFEEASKKIIRLKEIEVKKND